MTTKPELVAMIAEKTKLGHGAIEAAIDGLRDVVRAEIAEGREVRWPGLGAFSLRDRAASDGRNPRTGEAIKIPASKIVKFSPAAEMKRAVNAAV